LKISETNSDGHSASIEGLNFRKKIWEKKFLKGAIFYWQKVFGGEDMHDILCIMGEKGLFCMIYCALWVL
jgi:hypothetical protein